MQSFFGDFMQMVAPTKSKEEKLFTWLEDGKPELVLELILDPAVKLDLVKRSSSGHTAMALVAAHGFDNLVGPLAARRRELLDDTTGSRQYTPLHLACARAHAGAVEALLAAGADPERRDKLGRAPGEIDAATWEEGSRAWREAREAAEREAQRRAEYTHGDGQVEAVRVVKKHSDAEGGGYTIFVPSLDRERQTIADRLVFPEGSPYAP